MEFGTSPAIRRVAKPGFRPNPAPVVDAAAYNIQFYADFPTDVIGIEEFESIARQRFEMLKSIAEFKELHNKYSDKYEQEVKRLFNREFPIGFAADAPEWTRLSPKEKAAWKRKDLIGHYILRLAFCRTPEDQQFFLTNETELFRFRIRQEKTDAVNAFLRDTNFEGEIARPDEIAVYSDRLKSVYLYQPHFVLTKEIFWKIPFLSASELVRKRKCFLVRGTAYVPLFDMQHVLGMRLRAQTARAMNQMQRFLNHFGVEPKIQALLTRLNENAYCGKAYTGDTTVGIKQSDINTLVADFPLCMRAVHAHFRATHHLRYHARQQYGLFLKAIGLPLEEALALMRLEFTKKMEADKFDKQYAYNIRHMYGKEGRRKDYSALPCQQIILGQPPAAGDCHGCPFKHVQPAALEKRLLADGRSQAEVKQILDLAKNSQFDKACTREFEFARGMSQGGLGLTIVHPNQYFELATQVKTGKRVEEHIQVLTSHATQPLANSQQDIDDFDSEPMES